MNVYLNKNVIKKCNRYMLLDYKNLVNLLTHQIFEKNVYTQMFIEKRPRITSIIYFCSEHVIRSWTSHVESVYYIYTRLD